MGIKLNISKIVDSCYRNLVAYFSHMTIEKVAFLICFTIGIVFLFVAIFGPWRYYVLTAVSFISAFIVTEEREK